MKNIIFGISIAMVVAIVSFLFYVVISMTTTSRALDQLIKRQKSQNVFFQEVIEANDSLVKNDVDGDFEDTGRIQL